MTRSFWLLFVLAGLAACKDTDADGVRDNRDCAPGDPKANPDAKEVCDGIDNDCDGQVDEDVATLAYLDRDGDGAGDPDFSRRVCDVPDNGVTVAGDCDDFDADVALGLDEVCDGKDNNCDGTADEGVTTTYFPDDDGDGHGVSGQSVEACQPGPGVSTIDDDCDDTSADAYPGAVELCNGADDDCDSDADEDLATVRLWEDADGDGYGDPARPTVGCGPSAGLSDNALDCDDADPNHSPDTAEGRGNGADDDCDGYVDEFGVGPTSEFATLEDALGSAPDGSVVQFDAGLFLGAFDIRGRDITLAGEGCGRTTLYGDGAGSTVSMDAGTLTGLSVGGGTGTDVPLQGGAVGGGVFVEGDATIRSVCVEGNSAYRGGGVGVVAGHVVVEDVTFADNNADWVGGGLFGAYPATLELRGSRLLGNSSQQYGGGFGLEGVPIDVTNVVIAGNTAYVKGAGAYFGEESDGAGGWVESVGTLDHVTFHANRTIPASTGRVGEAILVIGSSVQVTSSLFTGHTEPNTVVEAQQDNSYSGLINVSTSGFRGNAGGDKDLQTYFLDRQDGEPRYVDVDPSAPPSSWDLHLQFDSEFRDAGDSADDPDGSVSDLGAYGGALAPAGWDFGWAVDDDGDGVPSASEIAYRTDRWVADAQEDPDQDGLGNMVEIGMRTDPFAFDTDGDGVDDSVEDGLGTDPLARRDHAPAADVGVLVRLGLSGEPLPLDASASGDPNDDVVTFAWSLVSAPPTSFATLTDTTAQVSFTPDVAGTYVARVTVSDGTAASTADVELRVRDGFVVPDDFATLGEALASVVDGEAVGLRPGTYPERLDLTGRDLALFGLGDSPADTILEGWGRGSVIVADAGTVSVGNLTVQGGRGSQGGGVRAVDGVRLSLHDVVVRQNHALEGAGVYVASTPLELTDVTFDQNAATGNGGHLHLLGGDDHEALMGRRVRFLRGLGADGGALYFDGDDTTGDADGWLDGVEFVDNEATEGAAWRHRGRGSDLVVRHAVFLANKADTLFNSTEGREILLSSVVAGNELDALVGGSTNGVFQALGAVWTEFPPGPFGGPGLDLDANPTWVDLPPRLVSFLDEGEVDSDLLIARLDSPARDAGFVELTDRDGSRSDATSCAGSAAPARCVLALRDLDADGLPDGWEEAFGTTLGVDDAAVDLDGDTLTNLQELERGTRPDLTDSDLDGVVDAADFEPTKDDGRPRVYLDYEYSAVVGVPAVVDSSSDDVETVRWRIVSAPGGSTSQLSDDEGPTVSLTPDTEGAYLVEAVGVSDDGVESRPVITWVVVPEIHDVPADFPTLDDAVAAALPGDTIRLAAGEYPTFLRIDDKSLVILGAGADQTSLVGRPAEPVAYLTGGFDFTFRDLSIVGGSNQNGGGVRCDDSTLVLDRVHVKDNVGYTGGGLYLFYCDTRITDSRIEGNHASNQGAAIYADSGTLELDRVVVASNQSDKSAAGLQLLSVTAALNNVTFVGNESIGSGAALMVQKQVNNELGSLSVWNSTFASNDAGTGGTLHRVDDLPVTLVNSVFVDNQGTAIQDATGGVAFDSHHNLFFDNTTHSSPASIAAEPTSFVDVDPVLAAVDLDDDGGGDPADQDLRLRERSPVLDAGDPSTLDPDGSVAALGAWGGPGAGVGWDEYLVDTDGDGMSDVWESEHGLDPGVVEGSGDADGDGLTDAQEFPTSHPDAADSDGDGVDDPAEAGFGTDPLDATDQAPAVTLGTPELVGAPGVLFQRTVTAFDPQASPIAAYDWDLVEVPGGSAITQASLGGAATATVVFTPDEPGLYVLNVRASDGAGWGHAERLELRVSGLLQVPGHYADVGSAVDAAVDGTVIEVGPGTWPCHADVEVDLEIVGAGIGLTVLDGEGRNRQIRADATTTLRLADLTMTGGSGGQGGAVWLRDGALTLEGVEFVDNTAVEGGALYVNDDGVVDGAGLWFTSNAAGMRGGAMMASEGDLTFERTVFAENIAPDDQGGAIRLYQAALTLENVVFSDNFAEEGGAIYAYGGSSFVVMDHVTATLNEATLYGAVLRISSGAGGSTTNSIFTANAGHSVVADTSSAGVWGMSYTLVDANTTDLTWSMTRNPSPVDGVDGNLVNNAYVVDFVSLTDDGDWTNDDWHLLATSDAVDAGDPLADPDVDTSPADLGAHGGPFGDF